MKKRTIFLVLILSTLFVIPTTMQAQESEKKSKFGLFIRRAAEVVTGINMTNDFFVQNPLSMVVDIVLVECIGDPTTGYVNLIFKARNKTYAENMSFGGSLDGTVAFDSQGRQYKPYTSSRTRVASSRGLWSEVRLEGRKGGFSDVPAGLPVMKLFKVYCYIDADNTGHIEFRNIPIVWR